ncbi:MAG: Fic family protein [Tepidisphaerales bacterium]
MIFGLPEIPADQLDVVRRVQELRHKLKYATSERRVWTRHLLRAELAQAVQSSIGIEGYQVSLADAMAIVDGDEPPEAKGEPRSANRGYQQAMTYILQLADDPHFTYSTDLLRSLHYMMLSYDLDMRPGRWRTGDVYVTQGDRGTVAYEAPDPDGVPALMHELIDSLNAAGDQPALIRASLAHLNLAMIHPFKDGNGRMARALHTLVLAREGILAPEFCSIERFLARFPHRYYSVLAEVGQGRWQPHRDAAPWTRFCLTAHYWQAANLLKNTREQEQIWTALEGLASADRLPERMLPALFDATMHWGLSNATYRRAAEVSDAVATRDLNVLVKKGLLEPVGEKRGRTYLSGRKLTEIEDRFLRPPDHADPFTGEAIR